MTRLMVLGLLAEYGPMSGYEIQQAMQSSQTDKWAGVFPASIYHALKKMEQENLVQLDTIEQTGNRSKAIYSITAQGRDDYKQLLIESFMQSSVVFPTTLYTALTFFKSAPISDIILALNKHEEAIKHLYEEMKAGEAAKAQVSNIPENVLFIFENIYQQCEMQLEFIRKIKHFISRQ